jgi:hypothetical protein
VLTVVPGAADADDRRFPDRVVLIDELVREGARRMLAEALRAEVDAYIAQFIGERDERGRRLVVRNGTHHPRHRRGHERPRRRVPPQLRVCDKNTRRGG